MVLNMECLKLVYDNPLVTICFLWMIFDGVCGVIDSIGKFNKCESKQKNDSVVEDVKNDESR